MLTGLVHLRALAALALGLKRFRAFDALYQIPVIPPAILRLFQLATFWVIPRSGLPADPGERLAAALSHFGPAYIKLGQTLATRPDLVGRPVAAGLATLQDRLPPFAPSAARAEIVAALGGRVEDHFRSFDDNAVAAASIAQVHRAETTDGRPVAVKILRPGIEARFSRDIALFRWIAGVGERYSSEARRLRLIAVAEETRRATEEEMDLRREAAAAAELGDRMAGEPGYRVPGIDWPRTARRVMTLDWVEGIRLGDRDSLKAAGHDLHDLAERVVQIFLIQAMRDGYFHADLHQGNLIVTPDGTLTALDFGIMGRLGKRERFFLAEILFSFIRGDYRRAAEVHFEAGYVPADQDVDAFADALRGIAEPLRDVPVEEISAGKLLGQLFATTERFQMRARPELLLLQRTMVMAEGMALHLDPGSNMWTMAEPVIRDWVRDNLSPEARLADLLNRLPALARAFADQLLAAPPVASSSAPPVAVPAPVVVERMPRWFWPGLTAGLLLALILT